MSNSFYHERYCLTKAQREIIESLLPAPKSTGRELAEIHLNYESQPPAEVQLEIRDEELGIEIFRMQKMRFAKDDSTTLIYNRHIKIKNIPPRSFDYVVNGRSPLEWLIDRYQIKTDKASGIVNDANARALSTTTRAIFWI